MPGDPHIAGVILAAGASTRMGAPKQLLALGGEPLVRAIAREALASRCTRVAVVLGAHADAIAPALDGLAVTIVRNEQWQEGMASSVRCAAAWAGEADALLLMVCDQPRLTAAHLDALIAAGPFAASAYAGTLGVPALLPRRMYGALLRSEGDRGARGLLAGATPVPWPDGELDLDTPTDTRRLR
jgi:CTP:molybdopterin cytidylyltransferase MocA